MIQSARFTNINGMFVDFNTDQIPFNNFVTTVDMRFTEKDRSQEHGIYPGEEYMGKRLFHCEGDLLTNTSAEYIALRMSMIGALLPRPHLGMKAVGTLDILFEGMTEHLTCECTLDGYPEIPLNGSSPSASPYQVNFKAYDPRLYGPWQSVDIAYNPAFENIGGRSYNKTYPKTWIVSASSSPGQLIVTNSGNIETKPMIIFYGPVADPAAVFTTSDGHIYVFRLSGLTLTDVNDFAVVDFSKHTVTRSTGQNLYNYSVGSDWFLLEPKPIVNNVRFTGTALAAPSHMSVQWRNAYMF